MLTESRQKNILFYMWTSTLLANTAKIKNLFPRGEYYVAGLINIFQTALD